jgi:hypothetical protein
MKILKKAGLTLCGLLGLFNLSQAQINKDETRETDSLLAHNNLSSYVIHNYNVNPTPSGPVMTWDHANGFYNGDPNLTVGWSNTEDVPENLAQEINSVQGMAYKSFDLNLIPNIQAYEDSVSNWLISLGIPVGINGTNNPEARFYPNPTKGSSKLEANIKPEEEYKIIIRDINGREVEKYNGTTGYNGLNIDLNFNEYKPGIYLLEFQNKETRFSKKVVIPK